MSAQDELKFITVEPKAKHSATVIFAHGLGDTGYGWKDIADLFARDSAFGHIKWVLPHAPPRPITLNMGMKMPGWFDMKSLDPDAPEDEDGMLASARALNALITKEIDGGIQSDRILLGGFSQGGAMGLLTGLTVTEYKLAGLVCLSGWVPLRRNFKNRLTRHATKLPIFIGHGTADAVIPVKYAEKSVKHLKEDVGIPSADGENKIGVEFHTYNEMQHSSSPEEIRDLRAWLKEVLPAE